MANNAQYVYLTNQIIKIQNMLQQLLPGGRLPGAGQLSENPKVALNRRLSLNESNIIQLTQSLEQLNKKVDDLATPTPPPPPKPIFGTKFVAGPNTLLFDIPTGAQRLIISMVGGGGSGTATACGECGTTVHGRMVSLAGASGQVVLVAGASGAVNGGIHADGGSSSVELIMTNNTRHIISANGGHAGLLAASATHASTYGAGGTINQSGTAGYVEISWH